MAARRAQGATWNTVHITTIDWTAWCFLRSWFACLREQGHRVTLVTTVGEFGPRLRAEGVEVVSVPIPRGLEPGRDMAALWALRSTLRELAPDIVHTHTSKAGFLGRLGARLAGVPRVVHTMHEPPHNAARHPLVKAAYIQLERLAARWADHVVTVSYANQREIAARRLVPAHKLSVIREGLDLQAYPRRAEAREGLRRLGIADDVPVVGAVGRLEPAKGHIHLLRALVEVRARIPQARCVIVGGGYLREELERRVVELGLQEAVILTGFREDMLELMQGFDVFALPSLWEGLGIVLLEAMAYERPLVASAVGGVVDVVVPDETGLLVPAAQPAALARALLELLEDPARAARLGQAGYQRLAHEFVDAEANRRMLELYTALLHGS
jgi:glycosyltransferase involved in cell wall biosynthesis